MPRGASQLIRARWGRVNARPQVARPMATGRTSSIKLSTQATPPQPKGLSSAQLTSAASRGKSIVIASWAN